MMKNEKVINLLLNTMDFENELVSIENYDENDLDKLVDFEESILQKIKNEEEVATNMYENLDNMTRKIFKKMEIDYYPLTSIFLEIADELNLI